MNKVVKLEELSLEELIEYHNRKMLEMFNLVESLLNKLMFKKSDRDIVLVHLSEFVRLYMSIEELNEKIRLILKENSILRDKKIREDAILTSQAMRVSESVAEELTELRNKIVFLENIIKLVDELDVDCKIFNKIIEMYTKKGFKIDSFMEDLIKSWHNGDKYKV
jgi:chromosome segregation and condensation protein ScpB